MVLISGKIKSISVSAKKGCRKKNVLAAVLKEDYGIIGDAHGGTQRQVSLLAEESIEKMRQKGVSVKSGDFAENITTEGIDLMRLSIGSKLKIGKSALLEITQIGKVCHNRCRIFYEAGDCIMPKEGIFGRVLKGGAVAVGHTLVCQY